MSKNIELSTVELSIVAASAFPFCVKNRVTVAAYRWLQSLGDPGIKWQISFQNEHIVVYFVNLTEATEFKLLFG